MKEKSSVFIRIHEYRQVLDIVDNLKKQLVEVRDTLKEINDLRTQEEEDLQKWQSKIDEIEQHVLAVDQTLFEPDEKR